MLTQFSCGIFLNPVGTDGQNDFSLCLPVADDVKTVIRE